MKKVFAIILLLGVFVSCWKTDDVQTVSTATGAIENIAQELVAEEAAEPTEITENNDSIPEGGVQEPTPSEDVQPETKQDTNVDAVESNNTASGSEDEKTEEEIVDEFEQELDSLFQLLE